MKTKSMLAMAALCLALPAAASAQGLPDFLAAVSEGVEEGMELGAARLADSAQEDLTLTLGADSGRIEAGQTVTLTVTAENLRETETPVAFTLALPQRLACGEETAWEAVLPPAERTEDGAIVPSVTAFTRTLTLAPGGASEAAAITCEMSMGTRFYRAQTALDLCVADVSVSASLEGGEDGRLQPGDAFAWRLEVCNTGMAAEAVELALILPDGVTPAGELPEGFTREGQRITGTVTAEQADEVGAAASVAVISLPMQVEADALEGDGDALRLMAGSLYAGGERVPLPRIQVCGPKISAQLLAEAKEMETGDTALLRLMVMNEGLAPAQVKLSCALPEGLELAGGEKEADDEDEDKADAPAPGDDAAGPDAAPALADSTQPMREVDAQGRTVTFTWQMDGALQTEEGVVAATQMIELPVRALAPQEELEEQLVGAALAYSVDGGDMQLCEAAALRLYTPAFLGIAREDWGGVFWACVLMMITVGCLYGAVRAGSDKDEYFCCE